MKFCLPAIVVALVLGVVFAGAALDVLEAMPFAQTETVDWTSRLGDLTVPGQEEIALTAVGDALWIRSLSQIQDRRMQAIFDVMRSADVAFLNAEEALVSSGYPQPKTLVKADLSIVNEYAWAGIDVVAAANNHFMDYGVDGMEMAFRTLDEKQIQYTGAGRNLEASLKPAIIQAKNVRVAFLAFMASPNMGPQLAPPAGPGEPGIAPIRGAEIRLPDGEVVRSPWAQDLKNMEEAIRAAKSNADFVAVSYHFHWGERDQIDATGKQLIAHAAIDSGADLILGHGPHVLNGIEIYRGKPIVYSMGHFIYHPTVSMYELFPETIAMVERFSDSLEAGDQFAESVVVRVIIGSGGKIRRLELLPVQLSWNSNGNYGDPYFALEAMGARIIERLRTLSAPFGTQISRESWYAVVDVDGNSRGAR